MIEKIKNTNATVKLEVKETEPSKNIEDKIKNELNGTPAKYFDISVVLKNKDTNEEIATISELSNKISITIVLPKELCKVEKGYNRAYYIVREHDGKIEMLEAKLDGQSLTFETDKFSTYAVVYKDTKVEETEVKPDEKPGTTDTKKDDGVTNPKTGDFVAMYIAIFAIAVIGMVMLNKTVKGKHGRK